MPSYRNQSVDLQSKSIDWFLYEGNKKGKKHVTVVTNGNFVARAVRKFYSDLLDEPNDGPQFCVALILTTRCLANIDKFRDPSICQPKKITCCWRRKKAKGPEILQELFVWFADIREALMGHLPKRLFKVKAKEIYAEWLEQNGTPINSSNGSNNGKQNMESVYINPTNTTPFPMMIFVHG